MATEAELVHRVKQYVYGLGQAERPFLHQINGAIANGTVTSMTVDDANVAVLGAIAEFEDQGEQVYIEGVSGTTRTIKRGRNGTTAASHSDNAVFAVNPLYTYKMIVDQLNNCMKSLESEGIYFTAEGSFVLVAGQDFYEIPSELTINAQYNILSVYYQADSPGLELVPLPFQYVEPGPTLADAGIHLLNWGDNAAGDTIRYKVASTIDALADTDNDTRLEEILVLGAVYRLLAARTGARSHDPGRETDRTVQPGQAARDASWYIGAYQRAVLRHRAQLGVERGALPRGRRVTRAKHWKW